MIFHNGICGKACENWLLWEGVTKVIYVLRPDLVPAQPVDQQPVNQLKQFGLVSKEENMTNPKTSRHRFDALSQGFWALLQSFWLVWIMMRSAIVSLMHASSLPARSTHEQHSKLDSIADNSSSLYDKSTEKQGVSAASQNIPILGMALWTCVSKLAHLQDRMPWLTGTLSLMQWLLLHGPGQVCCTNSRFDRYVVTVSFRAPCNVGAASVSAFETKWPRKPASSTTHNSIVVTCCSHSPCTKATVNARTGGRIR